MPEPEKDPIIFYRARGEWRVRGAIAPWRWPSLSAYVFGNRWLWVVASFAWVMGAAYALDSIFRLLKG
jgi:hypothetical protein